MKDLLTYINEAKYIGYDENHHITGVRFGNLSDTKDNGIISTIRQMNLDLLISPDEEEFDYQWMNIYWDDLVVEFYMPNNLTNGAPTGFAIKFRINRMAMDKWMKGIYQWEAKDFKMDKVPGSIAKLGLNKILLEEQMGTLIALVMNRQPEPLWN